ncbi:NLR family, CARD domain containing 3 [Seminavis robusta]|uniref:NLR family, CARD domain containing 3 n=1 Tax=Seminavis robusta TaxID=568900 RepID=A0A9N8E5F5_9STRA|nr:NLR family, CARD domain containing 3 [Seminavis robusta]|eukprot:Sro560_g166690.1 NLR family, CARD domain containing 3 (535) ;mRNA; f:29424-31028
MSTTLTLSDSSVLSQFLSLRDENSFELGLEGGCPKENVNELTRALMIHCNQDNVPKITALFVHKSFSKALSEDDLIQLFNCLPDLDELSLSSVTMSVKALVVLVAQAKHLKKIRLDRIVLLCQRAETTGVTARLCKALSALTGLHSFHLSLGSDSTGIDRRVIPLFAGENTDLDVLVRAISSLENLRSVYLGRDGRNQQSNLLPRAFAALVQTTESVTIRNMAISPAHVRQLRSQSLQSLNLIQTDLRDDGALALSRCIAEGLLPFLNKLYVAGNAMTDEGAVAIVKAIQSNPVRRKLEVLDLHDNFLMSTTGAAVSVLLGSNCGCGLTFLDLSCNPGLGDHGGVAVASALADNCTLEQLCLFGCGLGNQTCKAIAASLSRNRTLKRLNLYDNQYIGEQGVLALVECLQDQAFYLERLEIKTSQLVSRTADSEGKHPKSTLDFFLRLNREFKRGEALFKSEADYLKGPVAKASELDLSSLFYLLSARPTLFSPPASRTRQAIVHLHKLCHPVALPLSQKGTSSVAAKVFCNPQA